MVQQEKSRQQNAAGRTRWIRFRRPFIILYKIKHLQFSLLARIPCALRREIRKNYQHGHDAGHSNFISFGQVDVSPNPFRTVSLCFGLIGRTPGIISIISLLKIFLSASANAIMPWQDVARSSLCSVVKGCGTKSTFRNQRTIFFGMFKYSANIRDATRPN